MLDRLTVFLGADGWLNAFFEQVSNTLWGWNFHSLLFVLAACGIYFTIRTRFVQFRMFPEMIRVLGDSIPQEKGKHKHHISSFQAFAVSVATRVGTGNLAGVATAISVGGPGAVFWMWMIALIGGATAFVESTLAQLYKRKHGESFIGGPAYYILHGLHCRWMAVLFAILLTLTFGLSYNSIQSNTITNAMHQAFGISHTMTGIILAVLSLVIIFGGIHRIASFSSIIVPVMAIGYSLLALVIVVMNYDKVPSVFGVIVDDAFGVGQFAGGVIGITMREGIKRGLFSNEAGEGSAPNVAATATVSHPVKQGLIQALGVFTDTILVCSCTAFIILLSGFYQDGTLNGIVLTQYSIESQIGSSGQFFVAIAILFFAFSSIIGNYYYGEANILFLTRKRWVLLVFRFFSGGVMVMIGALASLDLVWSFGDVCMAILTFCNLVAIVFLGKHAFALLNDYRSQKRRGIKNPVFRSSSMQSIADDLDAWK